MFSESNQEKLVNACVDLINSNRISSTEVADALGKKGVIPNLKPIREGSFLAGKVHYIFTHSGTNWPIHEQAEYLPPDHVVFVDALECGEKAIFGDLVAKFMMLYRKTKGIVVNGYLRDIPDLKKYGYPIWCAGHTPLGCSNKNFAPSTEMLSLVEQRRPRFQGGILVSDDSGCTLVEPSEVNGTLLKKLEFIELQEDVWSFCINTLKWSTYKTICQKHYLEEPEVLPPFLREKIRDFKLE
jgi:regulator of RNase E activity RraA